uniref:Uncharacterized protein n=1 Tax=Quercus lobata TaxID=97700 RepID=A0A7N2KL97_QUELO
MDAEDCEPFTHVFWIKFRLVNNARFAKKKLDEFVFLGNRLHVSYAPQFENTTEYFVHHILDGIYGFQDYFESQSMIQTVRLVREKFNKIQSSSEHLLAESASKKPRVDNRRRI